MRRHAARAELRRRAAAGVTAALLLAGTLAAALVPSPAQAQDCPPGATPARLSAGLSSAPNLPAFLSDALSGRLCIEPTATPPAEAALSRLLDGDFDMLATPVTRLVEYAPGFLVFDAPFLFDDAAAVDWFLTSGPGSRLKLTLREEGFVVLAYWSLGMRHLLADQGAETPDAARGLSIAPGGSAALRRAWARLGADAAARDPLAVAALGGDPGLDAAALLWSEMRWSGLAARLRVATETAHAPAVEALVTSQRYWSTLPRLKRIEITQTANALALDLKARAAQREQASRAALAGEGVEMRALSAADRAAWAEALAPAAQAAARAAGTLWEAAARSGR